MPFTEAIDKLGAQSPVGAALSSSEWSDLPVELRENAFFSANVESLRFLQAAQNSIGDFLAANTKTLADGQTLLATGGRAAFVDQMQKLLGKMGVARGDGGIRDLTSEARLNLIFDIKTTQAGSYGWWRQGMDPDVLNEFPASRFIRVMDVKEPRQSHEQFQDQVYLKTDPIWWLVINKDFGVPWAPFGWGCGHDIEDVDRDEADELGLTRPGQEIGTGPLKKFFGLNKGLSASALNIEPELLAKMKAVFGDQIVIENDTIKWKGKTDEERTGDSASRRADNPAAIDPRGIGDAGQEIFGAVRFRDTGEPLPPAVALAGGAHVAAVAEGRKPLYHEQWTVNLSADLAHRLAELNLPGVKIQVSADGNLYAYRPEVIQQIIDADPTAYPGKNLFDKIQQATLADTNGDLLGYGARTLNEPGKVRVEIFDGDQPVFGFRSTAENAEEFGRERAEDFERAYGRAFGYKITPL